MGFPRRLLQFVRCTRDGGSLALVDGFTAVRTDSVEEGDVLCAECGTRFGIRGGILDMLSVDALDRESSHERRLRDETAARLQPEGPAWWDNEHNRMEMLPTLEAVFARKPRFVLELGCGDGRYTGLLAAQAELVCAVDFSLNSLRVLQGRIQDHANVGLICADVTSFRVVPGAFAQVFSTLVSNLPSHAHRNSLYRLAKSALGPTGQFIFSAHHHGLREIAGRVAKSGAYREGHIYRYNLTVGECLREVKPHFGRVRVTPIQIYFPFARRVGLPLIPMSRLLERIPVMNRLASLLLCVAEG